MSNVDDVRVDPEGASNRSGNRDLADVLEARATRRAVLGGGLAAGAAGLLAFLGGDSLSALAEAPAGAGAVTAGGGSPGAKRGLLGFSPVPTSDADDVTVPPGYRADVIIPWGVPLDSSGPAWKKDASNTAAEQEQQIGFNHDGMWFFPLGRSRTRGLLVLNHEYTDGDLLYPDGDDTMSQEKVDKALAAHGVSVVALAKVKGEWRQVDSKYNRRITGNTPIRFSGPVRADHPLLRSELGNPPAGTLNNCANGYTPWGTYLTCEENWHGYFGTEDPAWVPNSREARYGLSKGGFGYRWHLADERFDVARNGNEANRFGWVVEINPFLPGSTPVKRTALGRVKHEGATFAESRGRAVLYMGDDENKEYFYKYVSKRPWRFAHWWGKSPLDEGTLYVARFEEDGTGTWLPLVHGEGPLTTENGWVDQADVLIRTREAADAQGATPLDRPEWCTVHPDTDDVYLTLTNGSAGPNPANPRNPNPYGHILKIASDGRDHTQETFTWDVFVLAGDPAYDPTVALDDTNIFGSPDGIWIDPDGRMWIQTDISNSSQLRADKGYDNIGNNAMLACDPVTGEIRRFLTGPRGCEVTGVVTTPDQRTMFVNIQHPGEATTFWGAPSPSNPTAVSAWPDFDPDGRPRPATIVITKEDGGKIGT